MYQSCSITTCHAISDFTICSLQVKDHINLADSEIYIFHFWGHYFFMPIFFNHRLVNWLLPSRWKLPKQAMEELSTSVRVIARLLWTVHMDYSQASRRFNPDFGHDHDQLMQNNILHAVQLPQCHHGADLWGPASLISTCSTAQRTLSNEEALNLRTFFHISITIINTF